jgi:hypothetical protein
MTALFALHGEELPDDAVYERARFIEGLACPKEVKAVLARATDRNRDRRFATMKEFCAALWKAREGVPPPDEWEASGRTPIQEVVGAGRSLPDTPRVSALPSHCPAEVQGRYQVLLHFERTFISDHDHGPVIFAGCQLLESELARLVTNPLQPHAAALLDVLRQAGPDSNRLAVLQAWADGTAPATLATHGLVLLALRHACLRNHPALLAFLRERFAPGYLVLLGGQAMERCLNMIRTRYRNPASHSLTMFSRSDYEAFTRLVIANRSFLDWDREGPNPPSPGADTGLLHHHWRLALQTESST